MNIKQNIIIKTYVLNIKKVINIKPYFFQESNFPPLFKLEKFKKFTNRSQQNRRLSVISNLMSVTNRYTGKVAINLSLFSYSIFVVCSKTSLSNDLYYMETTQLICISNKLTGIYMVQVFNERYFQTDSKTWRCHSIIIFA